MFIISHCHSIYQDASQNALGANSPLFDPNGHIKYVLVFSQYFNYSSPNNRRGTTNTSSYHSQSFVLFSCSLSLGKESAWYLHPHLPSAIRVFVFAELAVTTTDTRASAGPSRSTESLFKQKLLMRCSYHLVV